MMNNLSLTACSFMLKKSYTKDEYYYLNDEICVEKEESTNNYTVQKMFYAFFEKYVNAIDDEEKKKSFHCLYENTNQGETEDFYYLYAVIKSGSYGSSSDIVDNDTKKVIHKVEPNHTVEKPFYLYVVIPKDNKRVKVQKGMLFFQNVGPFGVKTITTDYMKEFFSENFNITVICKTIASNLFIERILTKENVSQIIMTQNHVSGDSVDRMTMGYGVETRVIGKLSFATGVWEKIKDQINYFAKGKYNLFEFNGTNYDGLKLKVNIGGRDRIINMNNIENLSLIEGIPDMVQDIDGHAKKELLLEHFKKVAIDYLKEMVLQIN